MTTGAGVEGLVKAATRVVKRDVRAGVTAEADLQVETTETIEDTRRVQDQVI